MYSSGLIKYGGRNMERDDAIKPVTIFIALQQVSLFSEYNTRKNCC